MYEATQSGLPIQCLFIFDKEILDKLSPDDWRVSLIYGWLNDLQELLQKRGSSLRVEYGLPEQIFNSIFSEENVSSIYCNTDYEPYARRRDKDISELAEKHGVGFYSFKDHVIFEKNEVLKKDGKPYTVFTPYSKIWKANLREEDLTEFRISDASSFANSSFNIPSLASIGFNEQLPPDLKHNLRKSILIKYQEQRDIPSIEGTSRLSAFLRFGKLSTRGVLREAKGQSESFVNELIWRDFYHMILWHFPQVENAFKPAYDRIQWETNQEHFSAWCEGKTGYPMVDAGMRQLNATGWMHNRVRMVTASFLCKHLLLDWRWGEAYFADKLLDFDLAANNGGWQWASGSGCDAAPYFRVFNPELQQKRFDPKFEYVRKWVPEFGTGDYPKPIVEHKWARNRALERYSQALKG